MFRGRLLYLSRFGGRIMKKQHLFTIDVDLVKQLHKKVPRGYRSQFVERAIRNRINNEETFDIEDISTVQLLAELSYRGELSKTHRMYIMELFREVKE